MQVEDELTALFGAVSQGGATPLIQRGVLHVVHAARGPGGVLHALRVGAPSSPHSQSDFFVLNLCRARADAVLTSAENLRREPTLGHQLQGPWADALLQYRTQRLQKSAPLVCAILTRTGQLPDPHPFWNDRTRKLLLCAPERASELSVRFAGRAQVQGVAALDARSACAWLRSSGHALVSVEAGPSSARKLYCPPSQVDELLLTHWESAPPDAELAGPLVDDATLCKGLTLRSSTTRREGGQTFRFERWSRQQR